MRIEHKYRFLLATAVGSSLFGYTANARKHETIKPGVSDDLGRMNEPEIVEMMWPGGKQPVTDAPYFIINAPEDRGSKNYRAGGTYSSPMTLAFYCPTHGAPIVYSFEESDKPHWLLYNGALKLKPGKDNFRVKAVRYGYKDSQITKGSFEIY